MSKRGVLVVGSANMDMVVTAKRFPEPGETVFGKKFQTFPGGKGANQAVSSAKLGAQTFFIGKFGDDQFREALKESMARDGVNLDFIYTDKNESTGVALITVNDDGQNEIVVISGSNMKLTPGEIKAKEELFEKVKVVICQLETPVETVLEAGRLAKQNDDLFILNPAPAGKLPDELLSLADYLIPNEIELELLSGVKINKEKDIKPAADVLLSKGVKNIIVTLGSNGSMLINREGSFHFPAKKVTAVDTTAAGDSFNGALAAFLSEGKSLDESIRLANIAASISVTRMGAQNSMPFLSEVEELLSEKI